jgi:BlaI family transcriptional regulator, penicillinase repressor
MARRVSPTFTEVELEFMHIVWDLVEATSDDIQRALSAKGRPLSDGSVRKILSILTRKGHLERRPDGRGFLYRASIPRAEAHIRMVRDLLDRAFDGSVSLMAAALLNGRDIRDGDIELIRRLLEDFERREKR